MPKQLTTQNATITTVAVEVKALTIGGKQVTLSVFRQLQEEPLVADDGTLNGVPWGAVNYHPDKCADDAEHLHVVWQKGPELRRARVQAPHAGHHRHPAADLYVHSRILGGTASRPWVPSMKGDILRMGERTATNTWRHFAGGRFTYDRMSFEGRVHELLRRAWRDDETPTRVDFDAIAEAASRLGISEVSPGKQLEMECLALLPTARYRTAWDQLVELPQLFIAV